VTSAPETFVARKPAIRFTANFEKNLEEIERFLIEAEAPQTYDALLDELLEAVTPNLERFPGMGRPFMLYLPRSVETTNALAALRAKLLALTTDPEALREYVLKDYLLLYAQIGGAIYLLAIRHQQQLSFDFARHWR
jgi:plasmid stabilization system protein ParE